MIPTAIALMVGRRRILTADKRPPAAAKVSDGVSVSSLFHPRMIARSALVLAIGGLLTPVLSGSPATAEDQPNAPIVQATDGPSDLPAGPVPALSTATSSTVRNSDGSMSETLYGSPVNYRDTDGTWQPIDNTLVDAPGADYAVMNAAGPYTAKIPSDPSATPVRFSVGDAWVEMKMRGIADDAPVVDGTVATLPDVAQADEVTYQAVNDGLKESITLDAPPTVDTLSFAYSIQVSPGLEPALNADGGIDFRGAAGQIDFTIPAAVMDDSAPTPVSSSNISYALTQVGDSWTLRMTPDLAWLKNPARIYPVVVDPTLSTAPSRDCFITSAMPNSSRCANPYIEVGGSSASDRYRGLVDFDMSSVPANVDVTSASVGLYMNDQSLNSKLANYVFLRAGLKYNGNATWNDSGASGAWVGGAPVAGSGSANETSLSGVNPGYKYFDVTGIAQKWSDDVSSRTGLVLKQTDGPEVDNILYFFADVSATPSTKKPVVTINYTPRPRIPTGIGLTPGGTGYTTSTTPSIVAKAATDNAVNSDMHFAIKYNGSSIWSDTATGIAPGVQASKEVPDGVLQPGRTYVATAYSTNSYGTSTSVSTSIQVDVTDAIPAAATCPTDSCLSTDGAVVGPVQIPAGGSQVVDLAAVPNIWDIGTLYFDATVAASSATVMNVSVFDPSYPAPVAPTFKSAARTAGASFHAMVVVPGTPQVKVANNGSVPVTFSLTSAGGVPWADAGDTELDQAEEDPDSGTSADGSTASDADSTTETIPEPAPDPSIYAAAGYNPAMVVQDTDFSASDSDCSAPDDGADSWDCITPLSASDMAAAISDAQSQPDVEVEPMAIGTAVGPETPEAQSKFCGNVRSWTGNRTSACKVAFAQYHHYVRHSDGTVSEVGWMKYRVDQAVTANPTANSTTYTTTWTAELCSGTVRLEGGASFSVHPECGAGCTASPEEYDIWVNGTPTTIDLSYTAAVAAGGIRSIQPGCLVMSNGGHPVQIGSGTAPEVRCDAMKYIRNGATGCILSGEVPYITMDSVNGPGPKSAAFVGSSINTFDAPSILTRHYWNGKTNLNRRAAKSACRANGLNVNAPSSCDEYPFASTYEGCYYAAMDCSVKAIPLDDNVAAGRHLGHFYMVNRILDGDRFGVTVK